MRYYGGWNLVYQFMTVGICVFFIVAATWTLSRWRVGWGALGTAALLFAFATYSFSSGLIMWPLVAVTLWPLGYRRPAYFVFWMLCAALGIGLVFTNYHFANITGSSRFVNLDLINLLPEYVAAFLANPLSADPQDVSVSNIHLSAAIGIVGLLLFLGNSLYLWRTERQPTKEATWLLLVGYSFFSGVIIALGRLNLAAKDLYQAIWARFVSQAVPFWTAVVVSSFRVISSCRYSLHPPKKLLFLAGNGFALVAVVVLYVIANRYVIDHNQILDKHTENCAVSFPVTHDTTCLKGILPDLYLDDLGHRIFTLARLRIGPFADPSSTLLQQITSLALMNPQALNSKTATWLPESDRWTNRRGQIGLFDGSNFYLPASGESPIGLKPVITVPDSLDIPFPFMGAWQGPHIVEPGVYYRGVFTLSNQGEVVRIGFGLPGDQPIVGDWNGDGVTTFGVYRRGGFFLTDRTDGGMAQYTLVVPGLPAYPRVTPLAGDWTGSGNDSVGLHWGKQFWLWTTLHSGPPDRAFEWGNPNDV